MIVPWFVCSKFERMKKICVFITLIILSHPAFYQSTKAGVGNHYPEAKGVGAEAKSTAREANMYIPHLH